MEFLQLVKAEPLTVSKDLREFPVQFAPTEDRNHLAPQAAELVAVLRMSPTVEVYESELRELLIHGKKSGILKTRQDPWRVFRWYRSTLDGPRISGENWPHKLSYKGLEHRIVAVTQNLEKLA
jgi:hypothetical protein